MDANKLSDFINCDIHIESVVQVYHRLDKKWKRNCFEKRDCEGFLFFVKGGIHYDFEGFSFNAKKGSVLKLPSGIKYGGRKIGSEDNEFFVIDFVTREENEFLNYPLPLTYQVNNYSAIAEKFSCIEKCWNERKPLYKMETKNLITELLTGVTKEYMNKRYGYENRTIKICEYISENAFDPNLKISDVAKKFYISETHLRRLFKEEVNTSPLDFLTDIRIKKAINLLSTKDLTVSEITEMCGYNSVYYFSNAFKKKTGISCRDFRKETENRHSFE